jgi:hypothetical protein
MGGKGGGMSGPRGGMGFNPYGGGMNGYMQQMAQQQANQAIMQQRMEPPLTQEQMRIMTGGPGAPPPQQTPMTQQGQQMQFSQGMQGAFADFLRAQQSGSKPGNNSAASNLGQQPSPLAGLASLGGIYGGMK